MLSIAASAMGAADFSAIHDPTTAGLPATFSAAVATLSFVASGSFFTLPLPPSGMKNPVLRRRRALRL